MQTQNRTSHIGCLSNAPDPNSDIGTIRVIHLSISFSSLIPRWGPLCSPRFMHVNGNILPTAFSCSRFVLPTPSNSSIFFYSLSLRRAVLLPLPPLSSDIITYTYYYIEGSYRLAVLHFLSLSRSTTRICTAPSRASNKHARNCFKARHNTCLSHSPTSKSQALCRLVVRE